MASFRLRISDDVRQAHADFQDAGGAEAHKDSLQKRTGMSASKFLNDIIRALEAAGPFSSVVDSQIADFLVQKEAEAKRKDAEAKAKARSKERLEKAKSGVPDADFLDRLWREKNHRRILFDRHRELPRAPAWLVKGPEDNGSFTSTVWAEMMLAWFQNEKLNASHIASRLIRRGIVATQNQNSFRSRVGSALKRIHRLESVAHPATGQPVWEKCAPKELLIEELISDADGNVIRLF